jgi:outer membrane immunogenic protein
VWHNCLCAKKYSLDRTLGLLLHLFLFAKIIFKYWGSVMKRVSFLIAAVCMIALTQVAWAAGVPPVLAPNWTGFYAGMNLGYGWTKDQSAVVLGNDPGSIAFLNATAPSANPPVLNLDGIIGGGQLGYNYQFLPRWLLGIEADFQGANLDDSASSSFATAGVPFSSALSETIKWFGTVRGRVGFLVTPNWLIYGTGGLAYGRVKRSYAFINNSIAFVIGPGLTCAPNSICAIGANSDTSTGWTAGGGFEYRLPNFRIFNHDTTVKVEYLYVNLGGGKDVVAPGVGFPASSFTAQFGGDIVFQVVRGGINVKF